LDEAFLLDLAQRIELCASRSPSTKTLEVDISLVVRRGGK
jgi:hypothetical protein